MSHSHAWLCRAHAGAPASDHPGDAYGDSRYGTEQHTTAFRDVSPSAEFAPTSRTLWTLWTLATLATLATPATAARAVMSRALEALVSPWDRRAWVAGATLTATLTALAVLLTAATDEGGVSWGERVARGIPLVPACAALATGLHIWGGERRGERRALEALGRSPTSTRLAAALGALSVGVVAALVVLVDRRLSLSAFFPTVHASGGFTFEGGMFASVRSGFRVMADGSIALPSAPNASLASAPDLTSADATASSLSPRVAAALFVAVTTASFVATLVAPPLRFGFGVRSHAAHPGRGSSLGVAIVLILLTAAGSTLCLQAAAAGRLSAFAGAAPSALLLAFALAAISRSERG